MKVHHILLIIWLVVVAFFLMNYLRDKRNRY
jgi:hypothetical protein